MPPVVIYTTAWCPYCIRAKQLLQRKGVDFQEIACDGKPELRAELEAGKLEQAKVADELGDVLFAVANLARHCKVDPEVALRATNDKFEKRFRYIERRLGEAGRKPAEASLEEMEALWQEAKTQA